MISILTRQAEKHPSRREYFKVLFKHKVSWETTQLREQFIAHIKVSRPLMNDVICIYCLVDPIIASSFLDCYVCSFPSDLLGLEENWKHCYALRKLLFSSEKREFYWSISRCFCKWVVVNQCRVCLKINDYHVLAHLLKIWLNFRIGGSYISLSEYFYE